MWLAATKVQNMKEILAIIDQCSLFVCEEGVGRMQGSAPSVTAATNEKFQNPWKTW
jgi:hypothetical protein